ncbi:adenosine deaminase [Trichoderma arundinaceum]|uniref:adenosine deaminase n=1 Tax=Trichoderma arundinaceum TaxID=490622 RepID=A0A395NVR8_TRIAR|nr:adenosine deaminase [Trichoderma arundinaceum]
MSISSLQRSGPFGSLDEYLKARESLVRAEKAHGYESLVQRTTLESTAEGIIRRLKEWEDENVYGIKSDGSGHEAGHRFFHGLDLVPESKLFNIAVKAPKGCLLHCHYDCLLPPDTVLSDARKQPNLYIKADVPLVSKGLFSYSLPQFDVFSQNIPLAESTNLFNKGYVAGSWMRYSDFLAKFPGGVEKAEAWLHKRMVLQPDDAYHPKQTVNGIWQQFIRAVTVIRSMLGYETAYREHFRRALWKFAQDGIMYAEIRVALNYGFSIKSDDGTQELKQKEVLEIFQQVLREEVPKMHASGEAMLWCMDNCIEMKQLFPNLICAFDMQGQEDSGHPLSYWVSDLLAMRAKITQLNLDLPFIFHAGETLDHGGGTDSNLYDAILLDTKRIGHGFSITKHPLLLQLCKERQIAIETCPISNEVLGLVPTTKSHHLPVLLANCVPCTVSSDDPGSWKASMLSHDFHQAMMGSENMSLMGWRTLAEWSISYSCMDGAARKEMLSDYNQKWIEFCEWIVEVYGKDQV